MAAWSSGVEPRLNAICITRSVLCTRLRLYTVSAAMSMSCHLRVRGLHTWLMSACLLEHSRASSAGVVAGLLTASMRTELPCCAGAVPHAHSMWDADRATVYW